MPAAASDLLRQGVWRWRSIPPRVRWMACGLVSVVVLSVSYGWQQHRSARVRLFPSIEFTDRELAIVERAFAQNGLRNYNLHEGSISVPRGERHTYLACLDKGKALPTRISQSAHNHLTTSHLLETSLQREARETERLEGVLSECIRRLDSIEDATVHLDQARIGSGFQRQEKATAMVAITPRKGVRITARQVRGIQQTVAAAKVELQAGDVTVIDLATGTAYADPLRAGQQIAHSDAVAARESELEFEWQEKISQALRFIPGVAVVTKVSLPLSPDFQPAMPIAKATAQVAVSVAIPESYYRGHVSSRSNKAANEELAALKIETARRIEQMLGRLLPELPAVDATAQTESAGTTDPRISIVSFPDTLVPTSEIAIWPLPTSGWASVAVLSIAAIIAVLLRGIVHDIRDVSSASKDASEAKAKLKVVGHESPVPPPIPRRTKPAQSSFTSSSHDATTSHVEHASERANSAAPEFEQELTEIVRENPTAAAAMLKQWVDKAG